MLIMITRAVQSGKIYDGSNFHELFHIQGWKPVFHINAFDCNAKMHVVPHC